METVKGAAEWIDIVNPDESQLAALKERFGLHPVIVDELKGASARSRVEHYDGYLFFILHFPLFDDDEKVSRRSEIDFIITRDTLVSIRYHDITPIAEFKALLTDENKKRELLSSTTELAYRLFHHILSYQRRQLGHIEKKLESLSGRLFSDREKEVLISISYVKRDISEYRMIIKPQEQLFRSLEEIGTAFFGADSKIYLTDLVGEHMKLVTQVDDYRQAIGDFEDTNNQMMNYKINDAMKKFSILSFLTFPFMLVAAIFSMNFHNTPLTDNVYGFWIVAGVIIGGVTVLFFYIKRKGWL